MNNKLRYVLFRLRRLDFDEWRDLFAAQRAIIFAQMSVWLKRRGSLVSAEANNQITSTNKPIDTCILNLGRAIDRAASFGLIRAQCLVRSMALVRLLQKRGYDGAIIRVGVSRESEQMLAHAWVEYDGTIVGDDEEHVSRFDQLSGIDVDNSGVT